MKPYRFVGRCAVLAGLLGLALAPGVAAQSTLAGDVPALLPGEQEDVVTVAPPDTSRLPVFQRHFPTPSCGFGGWCEGDKYEDAPDRFAHVAVGPNRVYVASGPETAGDVRMYDATTLASLGTVPTDGAMGVAFYRDELYVAETGGGIDVFDAAGTRRRTLQPQLAPGVPWPYSLRGIDAAWGEIWAVFLAGNGPAGGGIVVLDRLTGVVKQVIWHLPRYDCHANPLELAFASSDSCAQPVEDVVAQCDSPSLAIAGCVGAVVEVAHAGRLGWREVSTAPELSAAIAQCRFVNRSPLLAGLALEDVSTDELLSANQCDDLWHAGGDAVWGMKWYLALGSSTVTAHPGDGPQPEPVPVVEGDGATVREFALKPAGDSGPRMELRRSWRMGLGSNGVSGDIAYQNRETRIDWDGDLKRTAWQRARRCASYIVSDADIYAVHDIGEQYYELARGFQRLEVLLDGKVIPFEQNGLTVTASTAPMGELCVDLDAHASGQRVLRLRASVNGGTKTVTADNAALRIDHVPPAGAVTPPGTYLRQTGTFRGTMADAHSGPATWTFEARRDGESLWRRPCPTRPASLDGAYVCDWNTVGYADGVYRVRSEMRDNVTPRDGGPNVGRSPERTVTVDNTPPGITPSGDLKEAEDLAPIVQGSTRALHVRLTDATSGPQRVQVLVDGIVRADGGGGCADGNGLCVEYLFVADEHAEGQHEVRIVGTDRAGNERVEAWAVDVETASEPQGPDVGAASTSSTGAAALLDASTLPMDAYQLLGDATAAIGEMLPCEEENARIEFPYFSLGPSFEALPSRAALRRCDLPYPDEPVRANFVSYIYGDCAINRAEGDGRCAPPLEIQSWPACERSLSDYTIDPLGTPLPHQDLVIRGAPAASFDEGLGAPGTRLEVFTGKTTVVIFGIDPAQVRRAADAIRQELDGSPPMLPSTGRVGTVDEPLESAVPGAVEGQLAC